jgi:hypothetical protein
MMDVWICSSVVFLECVGSVDPSCIFGVLAYLFLFASSFSGIKLILDHVNFVTIQKPEIVNMAGGISDVMKPERFTGG